MELENKNLHLVNQHFILSRNFKGLTESQSVCFHRNKNTYVLQRKVYKLLFQYVLCAVTFRAGFANATCRGLPSAIKFNWECAVIYWAQGAAALLELISCCSRCNFLWAREIILCHFADILFERGVYSMIMLLCRQLQRKCRHVDGAIIIHSAMNTKPRPFHHSPAKNKMPMDAEREGVRMEHVLFVSELSVAAPQYILLCVYRRL
jgi:hypothetical protein